MLGEVQHFLVTWINLESRSFNSGATLRYRGRAWEMMMGEAGWDEEDKLGWDEDDEAKVKFDKRFKDSRHMFMKFKILGGAGELLILDDMCQGGIKKSWLMMITFGPHLLLSTWSRSDDDVVDGNVNEFDKKADESHDGESDGRGRGDLRELLPVRLCAPLDETHRVLSELTHRLQLHDKGVHRDLTIGWRLWSR